VDCFVGISTNLSSDSLELTFCLFIVLHPSRQLAYMCYVTDLRLLRLFRDFHQVCSYRSQCICVSIRGRISRGGHGLPKVSPGTAIGTIHYPSVPLGPFQGWLSAGWVACSGLLTPWTPPAVRLYDNLKLFYSIHSVIKPALRNYYNGNHKIGLLSLWFGKFVFGMLI
jgi:hypothetical protein